MRGKINKGFICRKNMKRSVGVVVGLFLVVMLSGVVSAAPCALGDDDTIMRLFQGTNSHGSLWNESGYTETICYSDIFNTPYLAGPPHNCSSGDANYVLSLADVTNAHASLDNTDPNYPVDVCYGDLSCVVETGSGACSSGELVARLFQTTNSHISNSSDTAYLEKICCTIEASVGGKQWRNTDGTSITNANIGDTVVMFDGDYVPVLANGATVYFDVIEKDGLINQYIRNITGYYDNTPGDQGAVGYWTITSEDLAKTGDLEHFRFSSDWDGYSDESSDLVILNVRDNTPPEISIINPSCGDHFDEDATVNIRISAEDDDDNITGELYVLDGKTDNNPDLVFSNGDYSFDYVLSEVGNYRVFINAVSRGASFQNSSSIMVIDTTRDGKYLAACITRPAGLELVNSENVVFDASTTTGIDYVFDDVTPYNIMHKGLMNFKWVIRGEFGTEIVDYPITDGVNPRSWNFDLDFAEVGKKIATLDVTLK